MRIRRDIWNLTQTEGDWPEVLVAYERAVGLLRAADPLVDPPTNPLGWRFLAAIHGIAGANGNPDTSNALWSKCQHGSWYFLAWHRMYILAFEMIVQDALGDDDWSLPYWYALDPDDPQKLILPPAFRDTTAENDLFTTSRSARANGGLPMLDLTPSVIAALGADIFSTPAGISTFGGGERSIPSFDGDERGLLEDVPHGAVHALVGNDYDQAGRLVRSGWMGSFYTAGLDPVFWLHHANVDRLWQVWLDLDPTHRNPTADPAWVDASFSFPKVGGGLRTWTIKEILDPATLGYSYESTAPPSGVPVPVVAPAGVGPDLGLAEAAMPERPPPQVLGTTVDVSLASEEAVEVTLSEPVDLGLGVDAGPAIGERVFLRIEGITGTAAAPAYRVYLNIEPGETPEGHPELSAGILSTFGMAEASQSNELSDGSGITSILDITPVRESLQQLGRWDPSRIKVSFHPIVAESPESADGEEGAIPDIHAGQVSVVAG
jgi:tyrosinase